MLPIEINIRQVGPSEDILCDKIYTIYAYVLCGLKINKWTFRFKILFIDP